MVWSTSQLCSQSTQKMLEKVSSDICSPSPPRTVPTSVCIFSLGGLHATNTYLHCTHQLLGLLQTTWVLSLSGLILSSLFDLLMFAGGLSLAIEGPSKAEIGCTDNQDGTCTVSYLPVLPGDYNILVKYNDKHIPGSPFTAKITGEI